MTIRKEEKVEKLAREKKKAKLNRAISLQRLRKGATKVNTVQDITEC